MTRKQPTDSSGDETKFADKQQSLENLLFVAYGSRTRATERQLPGLMAIKTTPNMLIYYRRSRLCRPYTNYRFCQFIERSKLIPLSLFHTYSPFLSPLLPASTHRDLFLFYVLPGPVSLCLK